MVPHVIANPVAGSGRGRRRLAAVERLLESWPEPPVIEWTEGPGDAVGRARRARDRGCPLVVAAGGDGTAHEVVNGLLEGGGDQGDSEFAYLPVGTGCDFARSLGLRLPLDLEGVARGIASGRTVAIDVGRVELGVDGREAVTYFLNAANIGLGPAVAERVRGSTLLRRLGGPAYLLASALEILRARPVEVRVAYDGIAAGDGPVLNLSVCNGLFFGGGMRPCPGADLGSGRLAVAHIGPMPVLQALRQLPLLMRGEGTDHPAVRYHACREVTLEGGTLPVEVDGEVPGDLPGRIEVLPAGLRLRWPL